MNCGKNVRLKPTKTRMAAMRERNSEYIRPDHLRPPEVQPAEVAHDRAADHDVVEMRDHEIGVVQVDVGAQRRQEQPGEAADR